MKTTKAPGSPTSLNLSLIPSRLVFDSNTFPLPSSPKLSHPHCPPCGVCGGAILIVSMRHQMYILACCGEGSRPLTENYPPKTLAG